MSIIDSVVRVFSPTAALERARSRAMLERIDRIGFKREGAQSSTNRRSADQPLSHPDSSTNHADRVQLIREARYLEENSALIKSILRKFRIFSIGRIQYIARTKDPKVNKIINAYVERWMKNADRTGRHHFRTLAGLGVTSMKRDGDIGFIVSDVSQTGDPQEDGRSPMDKALKVSPIRIQPIEADRIGSAIGYSSGAGKPFKALSKNERDFSGVVVNTEGVPLRYRIYNRSGEGHGMAPATEVKAQNFIHLFDPTRIDSYRGFSAFDAAINDIKDAQEILGLEKIGVKFLCSMTGTVTNATGEPPDDVILDTAHADYNAEAARLKAINPGQVEYMLEGEKFEPVDFNRPSTTFNGFLETLYRHHGLTVNLPFGCTYSWSSQGTAVRMEAAQAAREFEQTQLVWEERMGDPLIQRVLARAIQLGDIPAVKDFDAGEWRYPAKVTADVGRESKALIEENMSGLISKTQIAADRGEDRGLVREFLLAEQLEIVEDAKRIVEASGGEIDLKFALHMIEKRSPNAPQEPQEPKAAVSPDDGP